MNKLILGLFIILFSLINCSREGASINAMTDKAKIDLTIDLAEEKKIQAEVDNGHQPWRLDAVDVAYTALVNIDKKVDYKNCHLIAKENSEAKVECKNENNYHVLLKRLVRPNGIWTAVLIEVFGK